MTTIDDDGTSSRTYWPTQTINGSANHFLRYHDELPRKVASYENHDDYEETTGHEKVDAEHAGSTWPAKI